MEDVRRCRITKEAVTDEVTSTTASLCFLHPFGILPILRKPPLVINEALLYSRPPV